jgi:RimJ/RimL family protein N-acetyltransferase
VSSSEIRIRPYRQSDAGALYEAVRESIDEIGSWLEWCHPDYSIDESRAWIDHCIEARAAGNEYNFAIVDSEDVLLGGCGLNRLQHDHRVANMGYWVRTSAVGRGVATAATRQLAGFAFRQTPLNRLEIVASTRNIGSQRVAERAGARREAIVRSRLVVRGEAHDAAQFAFVRAEFRAEAQGSE